MAIAHGAAAGALRFRQWFALHLALHALGYRLVLLGLSCVRKIGHSFDTMAKGQESTGTIIKLYGCLMGQIYFISCC